MVIDRTAPRRARGPDGQDSMQGTFEHRAGRPGRAGHAGLRALVCLLLVLAAGLPVAELVRLARPAETAELCGGDSCCCEPSEGAAGISLVTGCDCSTPGPGGLFVPAPGTPWSLPLADADLRLPRPRAPRDAHGVAVPEDVCLRPEPPPPRA